MRQREFTGRRLGVRNQVWKWAETNQVLEGWAEGPAGDEEMTASDRLPVSGQA